MMSADGMARVSSSQEEAAKGRPLVAVAAAEGKPELQSRAEQWARWLSLPMSDSPACSISPRRARKEARGKGFRSATGGLPARDDFVRGAAARADVPSEFLLVVTAERLELREVGRSKASPLAVDLVGGSTGYRRHSGVSRRQPLARAVGVRGGPPRVLDATAGLGRDAFLLACLGCEVVAVERCAVLAALLEDGLARASEEPDRSLAEIVERITLQVGDAREILAHFRDGEAPEVVYLDPMYPLRSKSALVKKEMRICRRLVGEDADAGELLHLARRSGARRVVVKRHRLAPPLAADVTLRYEGRRVRYDVYGPTE